MDLEVLGSLERVNKEEAPREWVEEEESPPMMAEEAQPSILEEQSLSNNQDVERAGAVRGGGQILV